MIIEVSLCLALYVHSHRRYHPQFTDGESVVSQLTIGSDAELVLNSACVVPKRFPFLGYPTSDTNGEAEESERLGGC